MDPTHPEVCKGVLSCLLKVTGGTYAGQTSTIELCATQLNCDGEHHILLTQQNDDSVT